MTLLNRFFKDETGAVTVDWVVLTALIVGLAAAAFGNVNGGTSGLTTGLATYLSSLVPS